MRVIYAGFGFFFSLFFMAFPLFILGLVLTPILIGIPILLYSIVLPFHVFSAILTGNYERRSMKSYFAR
jgi:uncharacterized membrane protein